MTREQILERLGKLSEDQFARLAPFIEADLAALDDLDDLHAEIEAGRLSAEADPLLTADEVYRRARRALRK